MKRASLRASEDYITIDSYSVGKSLILFVLTLMPMPGVSMTRATMGAVAERFRALGQPARLRILHSLRDGERCVSDLENDTGLNQANLSRHLQVLSANGFVARRKDGLWVYYALADDSVLRMCDLMCGRVQGHVRRRQA